MSLVEKRYAEALINIAAEKDAIEVFGQDLGIFEKMYSSVPEFKAFLLNPQNKIAVKKDVVKNVFNGRIREEIINFLSLLLDKGRIKHTPDICKEFVKLADEKQSILNINIISAIPLDERQIKVIADKYVNIYKAASVKVNAAVDASLIGGVKVVIGDKMIDATVKGRLKDMQKILVK